MTSPARIFLPLAAAGCLLALGSFHVLAQQPPPTASLPVMLTSCGQSPGPVKLQVFMRRLRMDFTFNELAAVEDLRAADEAGKPYRTLIIVTGASLKGMGAAGTSIDQEIRRANGLIEEARRQNMTIIGAHVEGMERRAQGASPGDNSDELSIDAVCPNADILLIWTPGNEDGRFTAISRDRGIPMIEFEQNLEIEGVLKRLFGQG